MQLVTKEYIENNPDSPKFLGWIDAPQEVDRIVQDLPTPFVTDSNAPVADDTIEVLTYKIFESVVGRGEYPGPQGIGDCVGHGYKRGTDYTAIIQIHLQLKNEFGSTISYADRDVQFRKAALLEEFQEASCEAIYALSRVEVGGQRGSYSDGSVGAWAAKAVQQYGTISWAELAKRSLGGTYSSARAKDWGAKGLPDDLESFSKQHTIQTVSKVTSYEAAKALCQNGYTVVVCSNQGFTTVRDAQGFCKASGQWNHCMMFSSYRPDRPGLLCHQNWGLNSPTGPRYKDQPSNTFWVDATTVDRMLKQNDSFTLSAFQGYPAQDILTWIH